MLGLAVIAEPFAVIGDDDDERAIELTRLLERGDESRDAGIDVRDLAQIVDRCLETDGLGYQVFNATNDEIIANQPTADFLAKHAPNTPVTRKMGEFEAPMSNRKARELLGFREQNNWRKCTTGA